MKLGAAGFAIGAIAGIAGFVLLYYTAIKPRILAGIPDAVSAELQHLSLTETIVAGIVGAPAIADAIGRAVQSAVQAKLP